MSYPTLLDELEETSLQREVDARLNARIRGVCDYCHRRPSTPPCKFPERHRDARISFTPECKRCEGSGLDPEDPPVLDIYHPRGNHPAPCRVCGGDGLFRR